MKWQILDMSDKGGPSHPKQEDRALQNANGTCMWLIIADGIGGLPGGEIAAQMAANQLDCACQSYRPRRLDPKTWGQWQSGVLTKTSVAIREAALRNPVTKSQGMGTTCVFAVIAGNYIHVSSVGNSRLYKYTPGGYLLQLTEDHVSPEQTNELTSWLGMPGAPQISHNYCQLRGNELLMLCTDGVHGAIDDCQIEKTIINWNNGALPKLGTELMAAVHDAAGDKMDNTTIMLARQIDS